MTRKIKTVSKMTSLLFIFIISLLFCACNVNISVNQNEPASDDKKEALQEEEETAKEIRYNDNSSLLRLDDDGYLYYMNYTKEVEK